jgi:hypothetical protein
MANRLGAIDRMARPVDMNHALDRHPGAGVQVGQVAQRASLTRIIYPWWVNKLPSSQDWNAQDFQMALPAGVGAQVVSSTARFQMPQTMVGVIQVFGVYLLSPLVTTRVQFTLRVNQAPVSGWDNIQFPPGAANFVVQNYSGVQVKVGVGSVVDVLVTNLDGAAITVGTKIAGWYNSQSDVQRFNGEEY